MRSDFTVRRASIPTKWRRSCCLPTAKSQFARWQHPGERPKVVTQQSIDALRAFLREGDVAIDIGAHTGDSTLPIALAVGARGLVLALEPNPYVFKVLEVNAALNPGKTRVIAADVRGDAGRRSVRVRILGFGLLQRRLSRSHRPLEARPLPSSARRGPQSGRVPARACTRGPASPSVHQDRHRRVRSGGGAVDDRGDCCRASLHQAPKSTSTSRTPSATPTRPTFADLAIACSSAKGRPSTAARSSVPGTSSDGNTSMCLPFRK